jgi:hypothetical protein
MSKTPVHWIVDIVPLVGLLLSAVIYVFRNKRDSHLPARPGTRSSRSGINEFARAPMQTAKFKGAALVDPSAGSSSDPFDTADGTQAWNTLQAKLLRIAERSEGGQADVQELHRAVADYDALRTEALASGKDR